MASEADIPSSPLAVTLPRPAPHPHVQEGVLCPNRAAATSLGFFSGWLAAGVCELGIVPAVLTGFGVGSGYMSSTILGGLGWVPVVGAVSVALVFALSYVLARGVFVTRPREIAVRSYWQVVRTMAFAAGVSFVAWVVLGMSVIYALGGGAMHA